jgi:hypothetical protein
VQLATHGTVCVLGGGGAPPGCTCTRRAAVAQFLWQNERPLRQERPVLPAELAAAVMRDVPWALEPGTVRAAQMAVLADLVAQLRMVAPGWAAAATTAAERHAEAVAVVGPTVPWLPDLAQAHAALATLANAVGDLFGP